MRNKYLLGIFGIAIVAVAVLIYISTTGIKTKSFNSLINEKLKVLILK